MILMELATSTYTTRPPAAPTAGGDPDALTAARVRAIGWPLVATLAALNILDLLTTHFVLGAGGVEGNPLMAAAYNSHTLAPLAVKALFVGVIALWFRSATRHPDAPTTGPTILKFLTFSVVTYTAVVIWNAYAYTTF